ncbi:hypothetical protein [Candidatus Leptofilum sp.]|uniref:hypothetical protein n=1 Tax=Candidatus Leptofilum sp. TaxID=3241576 RepID=UPI003B5A0EF5
MTSIKTTLEPPDVPVVERDGRIVEQGIHEDLLTQARLYRKLYERQFVNDERV